MLPGRKDKIEHSGRSGAQRIMNSSKHLTWDTDDPCSTKSGLILPPQGTSVIPMCIFQNGAWLPLGRGDNFSGIWPNIFQSYIFS